MSLLREEKPIARKTYYCDASETIREYLNQGYFTIDDYRKIVKAKCQGWKIQPGQQYIKQVQTDGGEIFTYRAIPEMHYLCLDNDLWRD